jgi:hypothetical protein
MKLYSFKMEYPKNMNLPTTESYFINTKNYSQEEFQALVEQTARDFKDDNK